MPQWIARRAESRQAVIPGEMLQRACALFGELTPSPGERKLLHGDLHHDNILWDATRGWVAVDPKGVIGEPAYEFGALDDGTNPARGMATAAAIWPLL
ncbi:MAG TPA: aminoglycoside phosphotransferase family protein [Xanthobacteraceae bacterium]|nr:aminoglycoside phosphotransferase family protein [Xanthobacteraceae bacterium]